MGRTRNCRTTKRKTKASFDEVIDAIEKSGSKKVKIKFKGKEYEFSPKESRLKKAAKIGLGIGALASAGALGYYGYKNKDELTKAVKEYYQKGKEKVNDIMKTPKEWYDKKYYDIYNNLLDWNINRKNNPTNILITPIYEAITKLKDKVHKDKIFDIDNMTDYFTGILDKIRFTDPFKAKQLETLIQDAENSAIDLVSEQQYLKDGTGGSSDIITFQNNLTNNIDAILHKLYEILR